MRRRLVLVFAAVTAMVAIAFLLPLALLVRNVARDRAVSDAKDDTLAIAPVLAVTTDATEVLTAVTLTGTGGSGRMSVFLPDGTVIGPEMPPSPYLDAALRDGRAWSGDVPGGVEVVTPLTSGSDIVAVVRAFVPSEDLSSGVAAAWFALAGVGVLLVLVSVAVADRLSPLDHPAGRRPRRGRPSTRRRRSHDTRRTRGAPRARGGRRGVQPARSARRPAPRRRTGGGRRPRPPPPHAADVASARPRPGRRSGGRGPTRTRHRRGRRGGRFADPRVASTGPRGGQRGRATCAAWSPTGSTSGRRWPRSRVARCRSTAIRSPCRSGSAEPTSRRRSTCSSRTCSPTPTSRSASRSRRRPTRDTPSCASTTTAAGSDDLGVVERGRSDGGSTGLGLDIVRRTAESVDGVFAIGASESGGARFEIWLPLVAPVEPTVAAPRAVSATP